MRSISGVSSEYDTTMPRLPRTPEPDADQPPRIIGGSMRGRRLAHRPGGPTRPMKDRVRETLFDLLGARIKGAIAVDLFAGTGAIGFEALSRGAARAVFCERHFPTADTLRASARELDVTERCDIRPGDVLNWAKRWPGLPTDAPWVVFVSPPWSMFADREDDLMALITVAIAEAPAGSTIVVESDTAFDAATLPHPGTWESRAVPPAVLHVHHRLV
jgi:16S rRNA (guanine966-N2)-methyltransferase